MFFLRLVLTVSSVQNKDTKQGHRKLEHCKKVEWKSRSCLKKYIVNIYMYNVKIIYTCNLSKIFHSVELWGKYKKNYLIFSLGFTYE